ncbi:hypothetical protein DSM112329_00314 [Paraconexibacter sp. AEG42_29]|uniref:Alkaline shock response membrane anchor protein AmaP n=1 Tax=Paraconexibacter sp. AEG42_29 TaxID=2997339 RepID=A0AAU7APG0_9ACTN
MILLLRALVRVLAFLLLTVLSLAGLAVALASAGGGSGDFSLPGLLRLVHAPEARDEVRQLLAAVEANGPVARDSALGGAAAVLAGVLILVGTLTPRRERLVTLQHHADGDLLARRRPLAQLTTALVEQAREIRGARTRVRPRRRRPGARLRIRADRAKRRSPDDVRAAVTRELAPIDGDWPLRTRIRTRVTKGVE